ncbi:MAG: hypothetical protein IAI50_11080 [Candidatus Eremiobacteraeota bacterium]|nr:hypothetical protein [Candidatus Eremiobacteraeota bacterium]
MTFSKIAIGGLFASAQILAAGGAGSLDPTFGRAGKEIVMSSLTPVAALAQRNGRLVVGGNAGVGGGGPVEVARLLDDGRLDAHFGDRGIVSLDMSTATSLALQNDGKIIVAGGSASGNHAELVRLTPDGKFDASFGNGGSVAFDYVADSSNEALVVAAAPNGKIVAGGFGLSPTNDVNLTSIARFHSDGRIDATFGTNGVVAMDLVGGVTAIGLQTDDKILVCGGFITPAKSLVVRFLKDGRLDSSDAGGTLLDVAHTGSQTAGGTNAFQLDGKLVQWTTTENANGRRHYVKIRRLLRNNSPDPSFAVQPFAFGTPLRNVPLDVEIAGDGKLLVAGAASSDRDGAAIGLARLTTGGMLDPSFGTAGRVVTQFPGSAEATALAIEPDGKIVSAGLDVVGSATSLSLARYLAK